MRKVIAQEQPGPRCSGSRNNTTTRDITQWRTYDASMGHTDNTGFEHFFIGRSGQSQCSCGIALRSRRDFDEHVGQVQESDES
jgi:hypothetical protein